MNFFNVLRATRGLVAYIQKYRAKAGLGNKASIVVAHDTRHYSKAFCDFAAKVATDMVRMFIFGTAAVRLQR